MPSTVIPLAGNPTRRAYANATSAKDRRFVSCFFEEAPSPISQEKPIFVSKRAGFASLATPTSSDGKNIFYSAALDKTFGSFDGAGTTNNIFRTDSSGTTASIGSMTGDVTAHFSDGLISGVGYVFMVSSDGTGWYFAGDAADVTAYTADGNNSTTITDIKISGVNSTAGLYVGQKLTAASNIVAGSRIVSIDSAAFTAVLDTATTGGAFNDLAITKEPIAKITDSDFPPDAVGELTQLNGFTYVMDDDGNIYNSDLNSIASWNPANLALANSYPDVGRGVIRYKNLIAAFGSNSVEFFYHSSNATFGSPLMRSQESISNIGARDNGVRTMFGQGHGTVFFIGEDYNLYALEGMSARKLTESPFTSTIAFGAVMPFSTMRKRFVALVSSAAGGGQWYDIDSGMFTYTGTTELHFVTGPDTNGSCYAVADDGSGKFYVLRPDQQAVFQDNGAAYTMTIQLDRLALNQGRGFLLNYVDLIADTQASGTTTLATSSDDYTNFSTIGAFDNTASLKRVWCGGYYSNHAIFRLTNADNTAWRGQSIVANITPCAV